jgi:hypothetical protein
MEGFTKGVEYVLTVIGFYKYIQPVMSGFVLTLALVYILGKMLGVVSSPQKKNTIALVTMIIYTPFEIANLIPIFLNDILLTIGWIVLLYTLIGMRLFDHINKLQDTKFGEVTYIDTETGQEKIFKRKSTPKTIKKAKKK